VALRHGGMILRDIDNYILKKKKDSRKCGDKKNES
jgi:hypothetical protein